MKKDEQGRVRRPAGAARTAANETPGARGASGRGRRSVSGRGDPDALWRGGAGGNSFAPADEMPGAFGVSGAGDAHSSGFGASGRGRKGMSGRGDSDVLWRGAAGGNPFAPADEMPGAFDVSGTGGAPSGGFGASGRGRKSVSGRGDSDALRRGGASGAQSDDFGASGDIRFDPAEEASGPSDADEPGLAEASAQADPAEVWALYEKARSFNYAIDLYDNVEKNEDFYIGNQWRGVNAPDLDKPVINILARVVKFFISAIVSDDIGVSVTDFDGDARKKPFLDMLTARFSEAMEHMDFRKKTREVIRNAAVDGDGCVHYYFDPEAGGAQPMGGTPGAIEAEIIENTNVHFGNPQLADVEKQPYILLSFRRLVGDVRREAAWPDEVGPDEDSEKYGDAPEEGKVTVIRKYWKQRGRRGRRTVWFCDVTRSALVRAPTDTGLVRYPVAFFPWEKVKNQFHGQAAITGMIPNQIFINKLMAMAMQHVKAAAFPKVVYNRMLIPAGWSNRVGEAIPVNGDPNAAVASGWRAPDMSAQVLQMLDKMIDCTRDTMGASDAVLGNIKPDNTSAIVATQQATTMPLELQRQDFYSFVEASVRIWLDMMGAYYGVRAVRITLPASGPGGMGLRMAGLYGPAALPAAAGGAFGPQAGMPGAGAADAALLLPNGGNDAGLDAALLPANGGSAAGKGASGLSLDGAPGAQTAAQAAKNGGNAAGAEAALLLANGGSAAGKGAPGLPLDGAPGAQTAVQAAKNGGNAAGADGKSGGKAGKTARGNARAAGAAEAALDAAALPVGADGAAGGAIGSYVGPDGLPMPLNDDAVGVSVLLAASSGVPVGTPAGLCGANGALVGQQALLPGGAGTPVGAQDAAVGAAAAPVGLAGAPVGADGLPVAAAASGVGALPTLMGAGGALPGGSGAADALAGAAALPAASGAGLAGGLSGLDTLGAPGAAACALSLGALPGLAGPAPAGIPAAGAQPGMSGEAAQTVLFDFSRLQEMNLHLNVEIGAATYWSELMQVQTLDNLFKNGVLTDAVAYLENMPDGYIPGREHLIRAIQNQRAEAARLGVPDPAAPLKTAARSAGGRAAGR